MAIILIESPLHILPIVLCMHFTFITGQTIPGFTLQDQSYPNHGLVLINEIGETNGTHSNGLNCVSDLSDCCISGMSLRGEFDFPDESVVPVLGAIRNGYYRTRGTDRNILNRRSEGMVQGLFQCRIRTQASQTEYEGFYIGVYDENSGVPTVDSVSTSGLTLTCTSSGGPATIVTWRRNCAVLPNNAMYQQTQTVTQTQTAIYQNTLVIDGAVADRDGVYTCSVTNTRGYSNGNTGLGAAYEQSLPLSVSITPSNSPVAGGSLSLTCGSAALTPTYQWFNEAGTMIGTENTLTLNPLLESHSGEYSCLVTDGPIVGCGVHRVAVQAPSVTVTVEGVDSVTAGSTSQNLTCSVSGVDLQATAVMYTWLRDGSVVQAASTSNLYTISSISLGVNNAGDEYTCQVAIAASYWDVSGSFGGSGSGTLTVTILTPIVQLSEIPLVSFKYVGLNFTWRCDVTLPGQQLQGVDAVVEWKKYENSFTSSNDGRVIVGDIDVDTPDRIYLRSVIFSPLSAEDVASYSCSATVIPTVANPRVTNGFGKVDGSLAVTVPTLDVSIDRASVPARVIDTSPFNGFVLICIATSRVAGVAIAIRKRITWTRSVNGGSVQQLTDGASIDNVVMVMEDNLLQARSMSVLMVNTSVSGSHVYSCRAELVVAPAPDDISTQNQTTITVVGTSSPIEPTGLMAVDVTHNSATIRWTVSSLSYDPEIYVVQYGLAMDSLNMASSTVMGDVTPLNYMDSFQGSVTLTDLTKSTMYYYQVMATNSDGSISSVVGTFNTSVPTPEPPTMLQCSQDPDDPLSYTCSWMAPTETNGELTGYELTCVPGLEGIPPPPVANPSMTSATVSYLRNGVNYTCSVSARNEGGLSLPSTTSFYTTEIVPGSPMCPRRWQSANLTSLTVNWTTPPKPNGIITAYYIQLFSFDNSRMISETTLQDLSTLKTVLSDFLLTTGSPYNVRIFAENGAGNGTFCTVTDFGDEAIPGANLARNINITRIDNGVAANLSWPVLSLDRIGGYLSFKIVYSQNGGVSKHRTNSVLVVCTTSGCLVPYQQGWVIVQGLNPNIDVNFEITAVNEEAEEGAPIILILSQYLLPEPVLTPPSEVESHCSLVTWRNSADVSCEDISGYDIWLFNPDTGEEAVRHVDARGTFYNFLLLDKDLTELKSTTVQIRIVSSTGIGPYSSPVEVGCFFPQPSSVYFELKGKRYENNSAINILAIGEGDNSLLCKTNKQDCCGTVPNRFGQFFYPNGVKVPIRSAGEGFYRNRGNQLIRLNRRSGTSSPTGKYFCEIPDASGMDQEIFINIDAE